MLPGETVRKFRDQRMWTCTISEDSRTCTRITWGLIERGLNIPSLNTIIRLAEAFDVPAATLLEPIKAERKALRLYIPRRRLASNAP